MMVAAVKILVLLGVKPAMHRLLVMNLLVGKSNANLDCAAVAMLLCILCCKSETENERN